MRTMLSLPILKFLIPSAFCSHGIKRSNKKIWLILWINKLMLVKKLSVWNYLKKNLSSTSARSISIIFFSYLFFLSFLGISVGWFFLYRAPWHMARQASRSLAPKFVITLAKLLKYMGHFYISILFSY
jgi:hypothetical protein